MSRRKSISDELLKKAKEWIENGGTKKGACEILGVSSNKTMENQLDEYENRIRIDKEIRSRKRKEAVTTEELVSIITDHLAGYTLDELSDIHYRSVDTIKHHLIKNGALLRVHSKIDPLNPPTFPEECISESFEVGQYVWSAKYGTIAKVAAIFQGAYRIRVWSDRNIQYSYQPSWELGDLSHLEELGVDLAKVVPLVMTSEEITETINKTLREANRNASKNR